MGLRTPRELAKVGTRAIGGTRLDGNVANIDNRFVQSAAKAIDDQQESERRQVQFLKDKMEVENENDRIAAQAELSSLQGMNALDQAPKIRDNLKKKAEDRLNQIPERFRPYLSESTGTLMNRFNSYSTGYQVQQSRALTEETLKQRTAARVNEAIEVSGDDFKFNEVLGLVSADAMRTAQVQYGTDMKAQVPGGGTAGEIVEQYKKTAVSETIRRAMEAQLAVARFDNVDRLMKSYGNELKPSDEAKIQKAIKLAERNGQTKVASDLASKAKMYSDDPVSQLAFITANSPNDAVLQDAKRNLDYKNAAEEEKQKKATEAQWKTISDKVSAGGTLQESDILALPPSERGKAVDYATKIIKKLPIESDPKAIGEYTDFFSKATPEEAEQRQIPKHLFNNTDFNMLSTMRRQAIQAGRDEMMRAMRSTSDVMDKTLESLAKEKGIRKSNVKAWNQLKATVAAEWSRQVEFKPKNLRELKASMESAIRERGFKKVEAPGWKFWADDTYEPAETLEPAEASQDSAQIQAVKRQAKQAGLDWTDEQAVRWIERQNSK